MSQVITYRPCFKVCLWHAYYLHPSEIGSGDLAAPSERPNALKTSKQEEISSNPALTANYSVGRDLLITASGETRKILQATRMTFRPDDSGFSLWIRAKKAQTNQFEPFIPLEGPFKLTFVIQVKNPDFYNFTNIDNRSPVGLVYYFSNQANNRYGNTNYLNTTAPAISPPQNYVSSPDRVPILANVYSLDVLSLQTDYIRLNISNPFGSREFTFEKSNNESYLGSCGLELEGLRSGLYQIRAFARNGNEISALQQTVFLNGGDIPSGAFAVIEITHFPDRPQTTYSVFGADRRLLNPQYTLWWQNRSTYWRYLFDSPQPVPDAANPVCSVRIETGGNATQLVSKDRLPLLYRYQTVRFCTKLHSGNSEEILLPNPGPDRVYPEGSDFYSEVYMSKTDFNKIIPGIN